MALQDMQLAGRATQTSTINTTYKELPRVPSPMSEPNGTETSNRPGTPVAISNPGQAVVLIKPHSRQKVVEISNRNSLISNRNSVITNRNSLITNRTSVIRPQTSMGILRVEREQDSVIELAKFLKTTAPPPNNFMSLPENPQPIHNQLGKKPSFRMFRRQSTKSVSYSAPRHLRLPDSAVASKTIDGHWHIAISIPAEYDYLNARATTSSQKPTPSQNPPRSNSLKQGPIRVLPPIIENTRPATSSKRKDSTYGQESVRLLLSRPRSASVPLFSETKRERTIQADSAQGSPQETVTPVKPDEGIVTGPRSEKADEPIRSDNIPRRHKERNHNPKPSSIDCSVQSSEPKSRRARETSDSVGLNAIRSIYLRESRSLRNKSSASRPISEVSAAADSRPSSIVVPRGEFCFRQSVHSTTSVADSANSDVSSGDTKDKNSAQTTDALGIIIKKIPSKILQTPGPAPVEKLPDLPKDYWEGRSIKRKPVASHITSKQFVKTQEFPNGPTAAIQPYDLASDIVPKRTHSRREHVKAIRSRDMAALKATSRSQQVMTSVPSISPRVSSEALASTTSTETPLDLPPRNPKRRSITPSIHTEDTISHNILISLSPVMVVADFEPRSDSYDSDETVFSFPSHAKRRSHSHGNKVPTPPSSLTPSLASSDEEDTPDFYFRTRPTSSQGIIRRSPEGKHTVARIRRNLSLQEDFLDARMKKIEKTNALMIQSLNAVAEMGPRVKELPSLEVDVRSQAGDPVDRDLNTIEPLMRELQSDVRIGQVLNGQVSTV
jgi:hypothetical protein